MAMFKLKWLRQFVRRHTNPIPHDTADLWRKRLSLIYMLIAWQAFGVVGYMMYTGRNDWALYYGYKSEMDAKLSPGAQFAKSMNIEQAKIIRLKGFQKVGEVELSGEKHDDK